MTSYFIGHYVASAVGKTGLTPTADIWRLSDQNQDVTGGATIELGRGAYLYTHASADQDEDYVCVFHTTDVTVDSQDVFARDDAASVAFSVWDEIVTTVRHNVSNSAAKRLRTAPSGVVREETAQGSGTGDNQIQLDAGASATDGAYDPSLVVVIEGTGVGQARLVLEYDGTTKTCTVDRNWKVNPDATSVYQIIADAGREHVNEGLLRDATSDTATLNVLASSDDDAYLGQVLFIRAGTGEDQARRVTAYDGTSKIVTLQKAWDNIPNTTSAYVMLPTATLAFSELFVGIADGVWDEAKADHVVKGSFGAEVNSITTILNRLGAFTGTGINTILGFFRTLLCKDASVPSDVGGTFVCSTDSVQGIRDTLSSAVWTEAARTLTGGEVITVAVEARIGADINVAGVSLSGSLSDIYYGTTQRFSIGLSIGSMAVDITSDTVTLTIKERYYDPDALALLRINADVTTQGADGIAIFALTPTNTKIAIGRYLRDIQWTRSNGDNYVVYIDKTNILKRVSDAPS